MQYAVSWENSLNPAKTEKNKGYHYCPSLPRARAQFYKTIRGVKEEYNRIFSYDGNVISNDYKEVYTEDSYALVENFGQQRVVFACAIRTEHSNPHRHSGIYGG